MKKYRIFINIDKEETWINHIIAQGYRMPPHRKAI